MKIKSLPFLLLLLIFCGCSSELKQNNQSDLKLTANWGGINWNVPMNLGKNNTVYDSATLFHVALTIENPSSDSLRFQSMTCSYEDSFFVDDSIHFKIQKRYDCFNNVPCTIELPPHSKTYRYIMLRPTKGQIDLKNKSLKIGIHANHKTLWSNTLNTNQLNKVIEKN